MMRPDSKVRYTSTPSLGILENPSLALPWWWSWLSTLPFSTPCFFVFLIATVIK